MELSLGMKRFISDKKATIYLQTILKIRKMMKTPPETGASASVYPMEEPDVEYAVRTFVYLTVSE